jgi:hypothetical protein
MHIGQQRKKNKMKITKEKLKQIIKEELSNMEETIEHAAEGRGLMPFEEWGHKVLELLPNLYDAWYMGATPEEVADNLKEAHSMEAPTDPEAMAYARGEI